MDHKETSFGMSAAEGGESQQTAQAEEPEQLGCKDSIDGFISNFMNKKNLGFEEFSDWSLYKGAFGELIACMLFLCSASVATYGGRGVDTIAVTFGLGIVILVQLFAGISGGHINSAVTVGLFISGRCSLVRTVVYTLSQHVGSILGVAIVYATIPEGTGYQYGLLAINPGVSTLSAFFLEALFTGLLVAQVLACTDGKRPLSHANAALSIGLTVMFAHFILVPLTGCGINPSRAVGSAVIAGNATDLWLYWFAPMVGALLSPVLYEVFLCTAV